MQNVYSWYDKIPQSANYWTVQNSNGDFEIRNSGHFCLDKTLFVKQNRGDLRGKINLQNTARLFTNGH